MAENREGNYYLTIALDNVSAVKELDMLRGKLSTIRTTNKHLKIKTGFLQRGISRWKKDISSKRGIAARFLREAGVEEQNRAITSYESTALNPPSPDGMFAWLSRGGFYAVSATPGLLSLHIGNLDVLNTMTQDWKEKYIGKGPEDWYPSPPPYLNEDVGYWVWQEMGAGWSQHWLVETVERYPETYPSIGGNIAARHIFLQSAQQAHHAQYVIAAKILTKLSKYNPWEKMG